MKRDMELVRKILFAIEESFVASPIVCLNIDGYSDEQVAYHCSMLYKKGYVAYYTAQVIDDIVAVFAVGGLTWEGCDLLDKIREDTVWNRTKTLITEKGLPMVLDVIKDVSSAVIASMTEGAIRAIKNG